MYRTQEQWTAQDRITVHRIMEEYYQHLTSVDHIYARMIDFDLAYARVVECLIPAVLIGDYLLVYGVVSPWFSTSKVLTEVMLMRDPIGKPVDFHHLVGAIEQLAKDNGCEAVAVGNAYNRPSLTRAYAQHGFVQTNVELTKELPHG